MNAERAFDAYLEEMLGQYIPRAERAWRIVDWFCGAALRSGAPLAARLLAHAVDEALRTKGVEDAT